jgi:hypothetical protein
MSFVVLAVSNASSAASATAAAAAEEAGTGGGGRGEKWRRGGAGRGFRVLRAGVGTGPRRRDLRRSEAARRSAMAIGRLVRAAAGGEGEERGGIWAVGWASWF